MRAVNRRIFIFAGVVSLCSTASHADEREDATAAAKAFVAALAEKKLDLIWDTLASDRYKNEMANTREGLIAILTSVRRQIGQLASSTVLYVRYDPPQPTWAFKEKVIYSPLKMFIPRGRVEYVVIVEEMDNSKCMAWA